MPCVLVTGAAGFVGSHLIELLEQDATPIVAWLRPGTEPLVSGSRVIWHSVELHDREAVAGRSTPSSRRRSITLPECRTSASRGRTSTKPFAGNVLGTHHLFDALRRAGSKPRVLITSSAFVYHPIDRAITEQDVIRPNKPVRHQQARAGNGGNGAAVGGRCDSGADRARVQSRRAAAGALVRGVEHREADRGD
jgi:nucleoside-diphosphate-sugar epimerase